VGTQKARTSIIEQHERKIGGKVICNSVIGRETLELIVVGVERGDFGLETLASTDTLDEGFEFRTLFGGS